jgi:hypothetical protein
MVTPEVDKKPPSRIVNPNKNTTFIQPAPVIRPLERFNPVDPTQIDRNIVVRRQMEELRQRQEAEKQRELLDKFMIKGSYGSTKPVNAGTEATKLRLLMTLIKYQQIDQQNGSVPFKIISDIFRSAFKILPSNSSTAVLSSFLVFDKPDVDDSATCYQTAINGINKTQTTDYSCIAEPVESLSSIITDFRL